MLKAALATLLLLVSAPAADSARPTRAPAPARYQPQAPKIRVNRAVRVGKSIPVLPACGGITVLPQKGGPMPFAPGEELAYELTFAGAYIGRFETKVGKARTQEGHSVVPLFGRARTNAFVTAFQSFSGRYQSMADSASLLPETARTEATYGEDFRWEKIEFTPDRRGVNADYLLQGRTLKRVYRADHDLTDILTLLYSARRVSLSPGLSACQDVFGARRMWRMDGKVVGEAEVDTPAGTKRSYKVETVFVRAPHPELNHLPPQRIELDLYLSKDAAQTPLKFIVRTQGVEAEGKLVRWSLKGTSGEEEWSAL